MKALFFPSTEGLGCSNKLPGWELLLLGDKPPSQNQLGRVSWRTKAFLVGMLRGRAMKQLAELITSLL